MLDKYGYLHRASSDGDGGYALISADTAAEPLYIGPGRPLGYHVVENGSALLVCDSLKGQRHALIDFWLWPTPQQPSGMLLVVAKLMAGTAAGQWHALKWLPWPTPQA